MIDLETLERLQKAPIYELIAIIELLLASLKNEIKEDVSPQSQAIVRSQCPDFGFMKDTGEILGDVIAPILSEDT
ncbi:MAG: hypothetical protein H0X31_03955 [Nostocaceae cyanobacterium]|nr:hypothetical protein [Nostocaceae cyanobacterium]